MDVSSPGRAARFRDTLTPFVRVPVPQAIKWRLKLYASTLVIPARRSRVARETSSHLSTGRDAFSSHLPQQRDALSSHLAQQRDAFAPCPPLGAAPGSVNAPAEPGNFSTSQKEMPMSETSPQTTPARVSEFVAALDSDTIITRMAANLNQLRREEEAVSAQALYRFGWSKKEVETYLNDALACAAARFQESKHAEEEATA